jgi:hypothetical protein
MKAALHKALLIPNPHARFTPQFVVFSLDVSLDAGLCRAVSGLGGGFPRVFFHKSSHPNHLCDGRRFETDSLGQRRGFVRYGLYFLSTSS